jgi:hypothetical protein
MEEPPRNGIPLVPKLIMTAFVLGAFLWGAWMLKFVIKARQEKLNAEPIFVPSPATNNSVKQ